MSKIARILFLIVGCIFPVFIGALHIATHFSQLTTPEISGFLQQEFVILGESQSLWKTWGIVSFMMGASFVVIGLLNTSTFRKLSKTDCPPVMALLAMVLYQACVVYVGYAFDEGFQLYGGMVGGALIVASLFIALKSKTRS